jgi:PadR family transcriptional regulator PadR
VGPAAPKRDVGSSAAREGGLTALLVYATLSIQGSLMTTSLIQEKFASIRKGLLEFLILKIIASDKVYVADMLRRLSTTEFATQEGTLYPLLSKMRREGAVDYEWQESDAGPPRKYYKLTARGKSQLEELTDYWAYINQTLDNLGQG